MRFVSKRNIFMNFAERLVCGEVITPPLSTAIGVAAEHADGTDCDGRLPVEALAALRSDGLLGLLVPRRFGGPEVPLRSVANLCRSLSEACGSTGLIFAMHHSQAAVLIEQGTGSDWHEHLLRRCVQEQFIIASATTEGGTGGSIRKSHCFLDERSDGVHLDKQGAVISYAGAADVFLVSARRTEDSAPSEQKMVALLKDQVQLEQQSRWNPIGMRGACTERYDLRALGGMEQVLPGTFAQAMSQSMLPTAHILLASVWLGVASSALARAKGFLRARNRAGVPPHPVSNLRLAEGEQVVQQMRALVSSNLSLYENASGTAIDRMVSYNALKVGASEMVLRTTQIALRICGIQGYMEEGDSYLSRHIRDALSAMVMVNDDRLLGNISTMALGMPITRDV